MEVHSLTIELLMDTLTIPDWFSLIFCIGKRALSDVMERMGAQNTKNTTTVTYTQQVPGSGILFFLLRTTPKAIIQWYQT